MNQATRRAFRGLIQVAFVQALIQLYQAFAPVKLTADQVQAITLVVTPLVTFVQNALEDAGAIPTVVSKAA